MKKISLILICLSITVFLALSTTYAAGPVTIKFWTGYSERVPIYRAAASDYMKEHPNVNIEVTPFELRQAEQKFAIALPSGTGPDLFVTSYFIANLHIKNAMLDPAPDKVKEWLDKNFEPSYLELFTDKASKIYGIPDVHGFQILYYNLDYYKEAGLIIPPKNLDELMDYACKLAKYDDKGNLIRSGISLRISGGGAGVAQKFDIFLFPNGGSVIEPTTPDKFKANFANEAGYQAMNFYLQALHKYKVDSFNVKHDSEAFVLGLTAQFNRETYVIGEVEKLAPGMNYGIAQVVGGDVQTATNLNIDGLIVPAASKNKNIAWDFAMYLNKDKYLVQMMKDVGWICTRKGVDYSEVYKEKPHFKQALDRPENMKMIPPANATSFNEVYTKFSSRLVDAFSDASMVDNKEKIMKFFEDAEKEANDILKSNNEYGE
jgi:multiple sugar transport system substrate-binding protein